MCDGAYHWIEYNKSTLAAASEFIWQTFGQTSLATRIDVQLGSMIVDDINGKAYTDNNRIHMSARYIASYSGDDVKTEITRVLYHEVTHIWQLSGMKQAPKQLIEGVAYYIQLKAGEISGYCNSPRDGFVVELKANMRTGHTRCDACGQLFVKENYCPVSLKVCRDSESTPLVCRDACQRWVHYHCDGISDEKTFQFQTDGNFYYKCTTCRGVLPGHRSWFGFWETKWQVGECEGKEASYTVGYKKQKCKQFSNVRGIKLS
ncbi:RING/FYVE/PHD-type zinc finger family protein [Thalictrum thalictroides]|uniref:RING/FYVE/PHD-type zinc finger family protein n=1 Tax=Thalictrum thalictroides TaxID=46969 RepID=A0A7J6VGN2_THATH|nr:RING/FYVE/PHD-type zinc finger family protein [Thalictrum thalictroides]